MSVALGAPKPATVIAINLSGLSGRPVALAARQQLTELIGSSLANSCHIQPAASLGDNLDLSLILPDSSQVLSILRRVLGVQADLHQMHPESPVRFIVHHGLVFPSNHSHVGSSLRQAHGKLGRLPQAIRHAATTDFSNFAETWSAHHIIFDRFPEATIDPGLLSFTLTSTAPARAAANRQIDEALLQHLTNSLATHLGPFASVIVDAAQRASTNGQQLIDELCHEIEDPLARARFRSDAQDFLQVASARR